MSVPQNTNVYLETVEKTEDEEKIRNLIKLEIPEYYAKMAGNSRKAHWFTSNTTTVKRALSKKKPDKQWLL